MLIYKTSCNRIVRNGSKDVHSVKSTLLLTIGDSFLIDSQNICAFENILFCSEFYHFDFQFS